MTSYRIFIFCLSTLFLCSCAQSAPAEKSVGLANPASKHCIDKGGRVEILKNADGGEYGMCHLPDGTSVEEWELFRNDHKQNAG